MTVVSEVPLVPSEGQKFFVSLAGVTRQLTFRWCPYSDCWFVAIADETGVTIVSGIPLITGADLLAQYGYLQLGGSLFVRTDTEPDAVPTFDTLGTTGHLFFVTPS